MLVFLISKNSKTYLFTGKSSGLSSSGKNKRLRLRPFAVSRQDTHLLPASRESCSTLTYAFVHLTSLASRCMSQGTVLRSCSTFGRCVIPLYSRLALIKLPLFSKETAGIGYELQQEELKLLQILGDIQDTSYTSFDSKNLQCHNVNFRTQFQSFDSFDFVQRIVHADALDRRCLFLQK